jgi:RNA polymerase sigma-70 factor (ECF subfamily)
MTQLSTDLLSATRTARREFLVAIEEHRPALFRYCRRLTGDVWDAEDLVQDTLAKALTTAAQTHYPIGKPLPWLAKVATNAWIDTVRRRRELPAELPENESRSDNDPLEVRDALEELVAVLSPQERAALVLKDVFDYPIADIALLVGTTEGAVKAALHRGRGRLADADRTARKERVVAPSRAVVDALAEAFSSYNIPRMMQLFTDDAHGDVVGMVSEDGKDTIQDGSIAHTFSPDMTSRFRPEVHEFEGEPLIVLYGWVVDDDGEVIEDEQPTDVLRVETRGDQVARLRWYYFCPEVLTEVGAALGLPPMQTHGYRYG